MTQAEFYRAQRNARNAWLQVFHDMDRIIKDIYIRAAGEVSEKVKTLERRRIVDKLTRESSNDLNKTLKATGQRIAKGTETAIVDAINKTIQINNAPHLEYVSDAIELSETELIKQSVIEKMYSTVNEQIIDLVYSRVWDDGYTFTDRIYGVRKKNKRNIKENVSTPPPGLSNIWTKDIRSVVNTSLNEGRDVFEIAEDIQIYVEDGKVELMQRYGELERGTASFSARIPLHIDWRAIRLARSELYNGMQQQAIIQGKYNPAIRDGERAYRWNLTTGAAHDCDNPSCPDLAADSPYKESEIPDYPHPNCLCYITHVIMPRDQFVNDLVDWGNGAVIPYLDDWFTNVYLPFLR